MSKYNYLNESGVIVPDTGETLADIQEEFKNVFGQELDVSPETPQGVLITAETIARRAVIENNAALANQINPNQAGGVFLDSIWALTGGSRVKATHSIARDVVLTGRAGTIIQAGAIIECSLNNEQFKLVSGVVIGTDGTATGTFQSINLGAIEAPGEMLNRIITGVLGWETVSNPNAAEIGKEEESDEMARIRRRNTLALQGVALPEAIVSGLYDVDGVKSLSFLENYTSSKMTVEGLTLVPHSIYVCVDGGLSSDIAAVLLEKKSLGCGWNGHEVVSVTEPISGQSYEVKFDRPTIKNIFVKITIEKPNSISDPATVVRNSILSYANGEMSNQQGFVVGGDVSGFELSGAVNIVAPEIHVKKVEISTDNKAYSTDEIDIKVNEKATIVAGMIEVVIYDKNTRI